MDKSNFALGRRNFILIAVSVLIIVIGFVLMSGAGSTEDAFNPEIFSTKRIKVAPVVCFFGFLLMIYSIIHRPKGDDNKAEE